MVYVFPLRGLFRFITDVTVRSAELFSSHLNFEKAFSIGLRSGLYGGR